jgi:hypothetical protein
MRKLFLLIFIPLYSHSQSYRAKPDSVWYEKSNYYYAGIQANLLVQQFLSFNSNASINSNPFLFSYSVNDPDKGNGFALGTGLSITQSSSNDGVASVTTQNINVSIRIGYEKKYLQRQKFIPFWGVEMAMGGLDNQTSSSLNQSFNNTTTKVQTTKYFFGPSFRSGVNYAITRHILIGTEFFFNAQIAWSQTQTNNSGVTTSSSSTVPFNIGFQAPTAVFLMFRY